MNAWINKTFSDLRADRKKVTLMCGLLAIGMLLWGRLLIRQVPKTAVADPAAAVATAMGEEIKPAVKPTATKGRPKVEVVLSDETSRDPFSIDEQSFTRKFKAVAEIPVQAKSDPKPVDVPPDWKAIVEKESAGLVLQSTMFSGQPRALINGELVSPGQTIKGFTLKSVAQREAVLEKHGIQIKLEM
jgi:hypothetical protein